MPRFFCSDIFDAEHILLSGENAHHISKSLRMKTGESVTVCDGKGTDYACVIESMTGETVSLHCLNRFRTVTEPSVVVTLCQSMPKSDKLDSVIQKSVELGVHRIIPFISQRSVVRPDEKSIEKKMLRWNKISLEAAKQSERGIIPLVSRPISFDALLKEVSEKKIILFYEGGGRPLRGLLNNIPDELVIMIGPEGGFDPSEVDLAKTYGASVATLGKRILRTETAPLVALSAIMLESGNLE